MKYSAVAIGTFDGFHLGHRHIVRKLIETSTGHGYRPVVAALSRPVKPVSGILTTESEKIDLMRQYPLAEICVVPATRELLSLSAAAFFEDFLCTKLGMRHLVVGSDFAFGRGRQGDTDGLKRECSRTGTGITVVAPLKKCGKTVSSTLIREHIRQGRLDAANEMLGRFYHFEGIPEKGRGFGRSIGVPTVNLSVRNDKLLPPGVHAAIIGSGGKAWPGIINIGIRPTFFSEGKTVPEIHIFGFCGAWPRSRADVYLCSSIREERKFTGAGALVRQIRKDMAAARKFFGLS